MGQIRIPTALAPEVIIEEVRGDLQLRGWEHSEVSLKSTSDTPPLLKEQDGRLLLRSDGDCLIRLPLEAHVHIQRVLGDLQIKGLSGPLTIEQVMGSVELRHVGETQIQNVSGDLLARQVEGDFAARQVMGDAVVRHVQGDCLLQQVAGDGDISNVRGDVSANITGDAAFYLSSLSGERYTLSAGGDLRCYVPRDASVRLSLSSRARDIKIRLGEGDQQVEQSEYHLTLGDGQVEMRLSAGGSLLFSTRMGEESKIEGEAPEAVPEEVARQLADQIEAQVDAQLRALNQQLEQLSKTLKQAGLSSAEAERVMEKARLTSERAAALAREKMRRAQERLERKLAAARQRAEQRARAAERKGPAGQRGPGTARRPWSFEWASPSATTSAAEAVTDEERLMILRMLEQKKITVEQAEQLLSALEGKE